LSRTSAGDSTGSGHKKAADIAAGCSFHSL
jgi:hypothetical protein